MGFYHSKNHFIQFHIVEILKLEVSMNIPKYMDESTVLKMTDNRNVFKDGLLWGANHVGLRAVFVTDSRGHELFITSAHKSNMENLKNILSDKAFIDRIRKQSESKGVNEVRMDYFVFDISNVGSENVFAYNMQIMRQVHLMSIARNCFREFNFELPVSMSRYTIESLWELDQMRSSPRVSDSMRETWNETYTKAVKNAYLFYQPEDEKWIGKLVKRFRSQSQQVSKDWFVENHVQTCWELIIEDAWNYMKPIIKEQYPEFRYYMEHEPAEILGAVNYTGSEYTNFWKNEENEVRKYNIGFPTAYQDIYYSLLNAYNTKDCAMKVSVEEIIAKDQGVNLIYIPVSELHNWKSLTNANDVEWAIDDGTYTQITVDSARVLPVLYSKEDYSMVRAIQNRLGEEMNTYEPSSKKAIEAARNQELLQKKEGMDI